MRTEQAIREFIASRIAANLSPATISWYEDRLLSFAKSCPTFPRRPEPVECFLAEIQGSPWENGYIESLIKVGDTTATREYLCHLSYVYLGMLTVPILPAG